MQYLCVFGLLAFLVFDETSCYPPFIALNSL